MAEVLFYHLTGSTLEQTLPELLERSLARDWRAVVRCGSAERVADLDARLWTFRGDSFLPHGVAGTGNEAAQPVYLTAGGEVPNGADILFLVDGARVNAEEAGRFQRVCLIFNGHEEDAVAVAREDWKAVTGAGLVAKYWAQDGGRWVQKA